MIYRLTWLFCVLVFRILLRGRVSGTHHVPRTGAVIIASNHISNLDPPLISTATPRPCWYLAKEELFRFPPFAWFITRLGAVAVKRAAGDRAALKRCLEILETGRALVIFPEGTRSATGKLGEAEMGVGMMAYRSGAPVVPVYVTGTDALMPRSGRPRLARVTMSVGEPLSFRAPEGTRPGREEYERAAREVMEAIAALQSRQVAGG